MEIGAEVCQSLLDKSSQFQLDLMKMELTRANRPMKNAIFDIKSTNNDLLKGSLH